MILIAIEYIIETISLFYMILSVDVATQTISLFFFFFFQILKYGDNIFLGLFFEKEQNLSYSFNSLY